MTQNHHLYMVKDADNKLMTPPFEMQAANPARQLVELMKASSGTIDRADIEVAFAVLFGDETQGMEVFDNASEMRSLSGRGVRLHADFATIRDHAVSMIMAGETDSLRHSVGGTLSSGCARRIDAANSDAALNTHLVSSAADHFAFDALEGLSALLGLTPENVTLIVPDGTPTTQLKKLPFLCLLKVHGDRNA